MKDTIYTIIGLWIVIVSLGVCLAADKTLAQQDGFLGESSVAPPTSDSMLPPEAVLQGAYVQHTVQSQQENLHLLASFYYGNSREWRKIYDDNRTVIKNPNRLSVGQVLRIHVGDNWQPIVAYDTWFALAIRNGEWQPGVPWRRANTAPVPLSSAPAVSSSSVPQASTEPPATSAEPSTESPTPALEPDQTPTPQPLTTIPAEAPPSEHPAEESASPPENEASEPASSAEQTDSDQPEQAPAEEDAPAEPAF